MSLYNLNTRSSSHIPFPSISQDKKESFQSTIILPRDGLVVDYKKLRQSVYLPSTPSSASLTSSQSSMTVIEESEEEDDAMTLHSSPVSPHHPKGIDPQLLVDHSATPLPHIVVISPCEDAELELEPESITTATTDALKKVKTESHSPGMLDAENACMDLVLVLGPNPTKVNVEDKSDVIDFDFDLAVEHIRMKPRTIKSRFMNAIRNVFRK